VPRIALADDAGVVVARILQVTAAIDPDSFLTWLINTTELTNVATGGAKFELDVGQFPDGELVAQAQAHDSAGNASALSNSLRVRKDSTKPAIARASTSFILGPQTDAPVVLASIDSQEETAVQIQQSDASHTFAPAQPVVLSLSPGETVLALRDAAGNSSDSLAFTLLPHYSIEADVDFTPAPARLNQMSRWIAASTFILLLILLAITVFVRIFIQRPVLIAHTAAVVLLAGILLLL
jgi:hypothetical protein